MENSQVSNPDNSPERVQVLVEPCPSFLDTDFSQARTEAAFHMEWEDPLQDRPLAFSITNYVNKDKNTVSTSPDPGRSLRPSLQLRTNLARLNLRPSCRETRGLRIAFGQKCHLTPYLVLSNQNWDKLTCFVGNRVQIFWGQKTVPDPQKALWKGRVRRNVLWPALHVGGRHCSPSSAKHELCPIKLALSGPSVDQPLIQVHSLGRARDTSDHPSSLQLSDVPWPQDLQDESSRHQTPNGRTIT